MTLSPLRMFAVAAILVLAHSGLATAQAVNKTVDLATGGYTVGGPGAVANVTGGQEVFYTNTESKQACITVSNVGAVPVEIKINTATAFTVAILQTGTACTNNVTSAGATCAVGGKCNYMWRVDSKL